MRAVFFEGVGFPLTMRETSTPLPKEREVQIKVEACALCRTDLHILAGELTPPISPLILGLQIVGIITETGSQAFMYHKGQKVGVPWLALSCLQCTYCLSGKENLCDHALFTGFSRNGGLAEFCTADERFIFPLKLSTSSEKIAPLLCAGLIGYRAYSMVQKNKDVKTLGFYGFGGAAYLLTQIAVKEKKQIFAFTRPGDLEGQAFALKMGAFWAGDSLEIIPEQLDGAVIFAPAGELIPMALANVKKGSCVVSAGIYMSDIPSFPYALLYGERSVHSVTNLTRKDGEKFLHLANQLNIETITTRFPLEKVNLAIASLQDGSLLGSAVIIP